MGAAASFAFDALPADQQLAVVRKVRAAVGERDWDAEALRSAAATFAMAVLPEAQAVGETLESVVPAAAAAYAAAAAAPAQVPDAADAPQADAPRAKPAPEADLPELHGAGHHSIVFAEQHLERYRRKAGLHEEGDDISWSGALEKFRGAAPLTLPAFCGVLDELHVLSGEEELREQLFGTFDADHDGTVDARELSTALAVLHGGSRDEKVRFVFAAYDSDGDGRVTRGELRLMLRAFARDVRRVLARALEFAQEEAEAFGEAEVDVTELGGRGALTSVAVDADGHVGVDALGAHVDLQVAASQLREGADCVSEPFLDALVAQAFAAYDRDESETLEVGEFASWARDTGAMSHLTGVFSD